MRSVQSAFGGVVAIGGVVDRGLGRRVVAEGPRPTSSSPSSYEPAALEKFDDPAQGDAVLSGPAPEPAVRQLRSLGTSVLVQDIDELRLARGPTGGVVTKRPPTEERVARPGAGLARLRAHDLQRHRHRARRRRRSASAPASSRGWWRPRSPCARPGRRPRAARARATPSSRSPTVCWSWPRPASPRSCSPGGSVKDGEVIAAADEAGLAMVVTGERHFRH